MMQNTSRCPTEYKETCKNANAAPMSLNAMLMLVYADLRQGKMKRQ
jgi:hypothetical protein